MERKGTAREVIDKEQIRRYLEHLNIYKSTASFNSFGYILPELANQLFVLINKFMKIRELEKCKKRVVKLFRKKQQTWQLLHGESNFDS